MKRFTNWQYPSIKEGKLTKWHWVVRYKKNFILKNNVDIGAFTYINAKYGVVIEENVQIGSHCSLYSLSTIDEKKGKIIVKKNCKIGSHSIIMPGVTIGENSIIGACSFVTKSIPDNVVAYGIPAKVVKKFSL